MRDRSINGSTFLIVLALTTAGILVVPGGQATSHDCGQEFLLLVDTSGSMSTRGRMDLAKGMATDLVDGRQAHERSGLVSYHALATLEQPLTHHHDATRAAIEPLAPYGGTNAAAGFRMADDVLRPARADVPRVLVHITDGISAEDPAPAAKALRDIGVEIFVILVDMGYDVQAREQASEPVDQHVFFANHSAEAAAAVSAIGSRLSPEPCGPEWVAGPCDGHFEVGAAHGRLALSGTARALGTTVTLFENASLPGAQVTLNGSSFGIDWKPTMGDLGSYSAAFYAHASGAVAACAFTIEVVRCTSDQSPCQDRDDDGVPDGSDNCLTDANRDQTDVDGDGQGDACDDDDGDGVLDVHDNCVGLANPGQADADRDGVGDACDDDDGDGVLDIHDNCPFAANPSQADWNGDGEGDACDDSDRDAVMDDVDNCRTTWNRDQADADGDGIGDACDDSDGDGVMDGWDNCPDTYNPRQEDIDRDGQGDACQPVLELLY